MALPAGKTARARRQVVAFRLGREIYAVDILHVQEVLHLQPIRSIPNSPKFMEGVIEVRGRVIPVVDLKRRMGIADSTEGVARIVVLQLGNRLLGLKIDDVYKVLYLDPASVEDVPTAVVADEQRSCIAHIAKTGDDGLIIVIAPDRILNKGDDKAWSSFAASVNETHERK